MMPITNYREPATWTFPGTAVGSAAPGNRPARVCICILNWNGWRDTVECLESVLRLDYPEYQVVLVDNGSTDGSLDRIREWARGNLEVEASAEHPLRSLCGPPVPRPVRWAEVQGSAMRDGRYPRGSDAPLVLIDNGENRGFAAGMNAGIRYALVAGEFRYVWLLNNDTVVPSDSLTHLVARMAGDPRIGICGSTLLYYHEPERVQALGGFRHNVWLGVSAHIGQDTRYDADRVEEEETARRFHGVQGASMLVSRELLEEVGLLTEDFFLYYEEHDWAVRARRKGFHLGYARRSRVYHKEGRSTGNNSLALSERSVAADFYHLRSRILYTRRHHPYALPTVYVGLLAVAANRFLRGQADRLPMIARLAIHTLVRPRARHPAGWPPADAVRENSAPRAEV
jgi:GT2 family glycosyltransferase